MNLFKNKQDLTGPPPPDYLPPQKEDRPTEVVIRVDGRELRVPSDWTILRACRMNGIKIPSLCHHPSLQPAGKCGVCIVHVKGRGVPLVQSCKVQVEQGMVISTKTPEVIYQAAINLQEFLGHRDLKSFGHSPEIEDLLAFVKMEGYIASEKRHYAIVRDQSLCCACTRCVRACSGTQNMNVLTLNTDQIHPIVFDGNKPLHTTNCIACGICTLVCPTGAVAERDDTAIIEAELDAPEKKLMVIQTAPSARLSLGELMGEEAGRTKMEKTIAALHALGFDLVFDTTSSADTCATLEAMELVDRMREGGPFPLFTSCCPSWVKLVEKKYPHLKENVSKCRSPMMMLGGMIRDWMKSDMNLPRSKYFVVALMPCTAKKEEITLPQYKAPDGSQDIDVVLTVREMAKLMKRRGIDWEKMPGNFKPTFDEPFSISSGAGSLFGVSGGVMEAALRVAFTYISNEDMTRDKTKVFEGCRKILASGEWLEREVDVTGGTCRKTPINIAVISGARNIQQYLSNQGLAEKDGQFTGSNHFVECMACPGGCVGGGGQPQSQDELVVERRRRQVYKMDLQSDFPTPPRFTPEGDTIGLLTTIPDKNPRKASFAQPIPDLVLDSSSEDEASRKKRTSFSRPIPGFIQQDVKRTSNRTSGPSPSSSPNPGMLTASSSTGRLSISEDASDAGDIVGDVVLLYGSQNGFTATYAKKLKKFLDSRLLEVISIHQLDHFSFEDLAAVKTVIILTSTWESDKGLMPSNAVKFWNQVTSQPPSSSSELLIGTKFAVLGFGSTKYPIFCGFATQLHESFIKFGAYPFMDLTKIDVERGDKGRKPFVQWMNQVFASLHFPDLPHPRFLLVPAITPGGKQARIGRVPGYHWATVTKVAEYKQKQLGETKDRYFYVEFEARGLTPVAGDQLSVLPCNSKSEVESFINFLYPHMSNISVSIVPTPGTTVDIPPHLTVRQLFEQFFDLSHKPSLLFLERLESQLDNPETSPMRETLKDPTNFKIWAQDKTYLSVVKPYKAVIPPMEILLSMIPLMRPRFYTPIHFETPRPGIIGICVKVIPNGLCSNFLAKLEKGDRVLVSLGKTDLCRPADFLPVSFGGVVLPNSTASADFPLQLSKPELSFGSSERPLPVDELLTEEISLSNTCKEKCRFAFSVKESHKFTFAMNPPTGVIDPGMKASIKAMIKVHCSASINTLISLSCERNNKTQTLSLPLVCQTKQVWKLDLDDIKITDKLPDGRHAYIKRGTYKGRDIVVKHLKNQDLREMEMAEFKRECAVLSEIKGPLIVPFVGYCIFSDKLCQVTELMPIGPLSQYVNAAQLTPSFLSKARLDIANAMVFIHMWNVFDKNLCPEQILVSSWDVNEVVVKLSGFGANRLTSAHYLAPELADGKAPFNASSEVFSYGIVLWELYSCKRVSDLPDFNSPTKATALYKEGKRPSLEWIDDQSLKDLIQYAWNQDFASRPRFEDIVAFWTAGGRNSSKQVSAVKSPAPKSSHGSKHRIHVADQTEVAKKKEKIRKKKQQLASGAAPSSPLAPSSPIDSSPLNSGDEEDDR